MGMLNNLTGWHALLILAVIVLLLGAAKLPNLATEELQDVSPFRHSSALPVESLDVASVLILFRVAGLGARSAALLLRRRDVTP